MHWARDATEANRIVLDLVRAAGAREVVKVKSMATQETGLNEALADGGVSAWETDLAELIVQLGDDAPSHILVPAIHRNRAEIREIFLRAMGSVGPGRRPGLTDDPAALAEAARLHLRQKFLDAEVAISGANFAVAETGTLGVVESEGNGRMCLTLPKVLITLMGIEKVVPTWQDLEVFLQLLPRSSTGERMNPYTSTWTGVHPGDGPQEFHLVLLDNGRTAVLADPDGRAGAALHPLLGLPQRLPGLRADGRARLRLGLSGADRRGAQPAADRRRRQRLPALRLVALRRLLRRLPGRDRHPVDARPPARDAWSRTSGPRRRLPTSEQALMTTAKLDDAAAGSVGGRTARPVGSGASSAAAGTASLAAAAARRRGRRPATCPGRREQTFRDWWVSEGATTARRPVVSAREEVLGRIRAAHAVGADCPRRRCRGTTGTGRRPAPRPSLLDLLEERLVDYRATVRRGDRRPRAGARGARRAGAGHARRAGRRPGRVAAGHPRRQCGRSATSPPLTAVELDEIDGVLTGCRVAIAETGTLVLDAGPDQGRRMLSLVPDYCLVVVRAEQVVGGVPEAVAALDPTRPLTWISGPSATSDIELDRVEGVHGPRTLDSSCCWRD